MVYICIIKPTISTFFPHKLAAFMKTLRGVMNKLLQVKGIRRKTIDQLLKWITCHRFDFETYLARIISGYAAERIWVASFCILLVFSRPGTTFVLSKHIQFNWSTEVHEGGKQRWQRWLTCQSFSNRDYFHI